jgi:hypothetical protein
MKEYFAPRRLFIALDAGAVVILAVFGYLALLGGKNIESVHATELLSIRITSLAAILLVTVTLRMALLYLTEKNDDIPSAGAVWPVAAMALFFLVNSFFLDLNLVVVPGGESGVPPQLPGPVDVWAKDLKKQFSVSVPPGANMKVTLYLLESHEALPPTISVRAGDREVTRIEIGRGNGVPQSSWHSQGKPSEYTFFIPAGYLASGGVIDFQSVTGSWIGIDRLEFISLPKSWEVWRQIREPWDYLLFWMAALILTIRYAAPMALQPGGTRKLAMSAMMLAMIGFAGAVAFLALAVYVEIASPWLAYAKGARRPKEAFSIPHFWGDQELGWVGLPSFKAFTQEVPEGPATLFYANTRYGFRALKDENEFPKKGKVIMLGDSFVNGFSLSQEETIPFMLSKSLGEYVYNFGVGGYSPDQEYTVLTKWVDRLESEWVVALFYSNDLKYTDNDHGHSRRKSRYEIKDNKVNFDRLLPLPEQVIRELNASVAAHTSPKEVYCCIPRERSSLPIRIVRRAWRYLKTVYMPGEILSRVIDDIRIAKAKHDPTSLDVTPEMLEKPELFAREMDIVFQFFQKMQTVTEKHGRKFLLVFVPDVGQITAPEIKSRERLRDRFMAQCSALKIECLDPSGKLTAMAKIQNVYFLDDGHFSPYGSTAVAELIAERIKRWK